MMRDYEVSFFFVPAFMLKSFAEMEDMPIARIMVHGEKAASYMADSYARSSSRQGVHGANDRRLNSHRAYACPYGRFASGRDYRRTRAGVAINAYQEVDDITQFDAVASSMPSRYGNRLPDLTGRRFS
jgi:acetolactate synthase-1/2/3 large subunit